ncbi:MAG: hypothetical protein V3S00_03415 [Dehalococcoidia bacterium]
MPSPSRARYRVRQFFAGLRPRVGPAEREEARAVLGDALYGLFESMSLRDQRHCLNVYGALWVGGCQDRDLLRAALLHDAGKGRLAGVEVRLWHRVSYVALAAVRPALLSRLSRSGGLAAIRRHAERGALLAETLAAPESVVQLIRRHEERPCPDERLHWLREADDLN